MNALTKQPTARQGGMTLIELAVVLLILVGLAGLTLPYVGGFVSKTSTATGAASNADLYNALSLYQAQTGGYPNNLDLLTNGTNMDFTLDDYEVTNGAPMNWQIASAAAGAAGAVPSATNFSVSNIAASLQAAGINTLVPSPHANANGVPPTNFYTNANGNYVVTSGVSVTFDPAFASMTPIPVANAAAFVTSYDDMFTSICYPGSLPNNCVSGMNYGGTIGNELGYTIPPGHAIIVLGVGMVNSAIGVSLGSPPVVFAPKPQAQPQLVYARYMAAFDVDTQHTSNQGAAAAKLVGVVYGDSSMMLESIGTSIANYYQGLSQQSMTAP